MKINIPLLYLKYIKRVTSSWQVIELACRRYAHKVFLIEPDAGIELSFQQVQERIEKVALFLSKEGLRPGERIAFSAPNCYEFFEVRAACHRQGIVFFGIPAHLSDDTLAYFIKESGAKLLFCRYRRGLSTPPAKIIDLSSKPYEDIFMQPKEALPPVAVNPIATLNLSSGTTRKIPKMVQISDANWIASLLGYVRNSDAGRNKKIVFMCTVSFLTAGSATLLPSFLVGLTYIVVKGTMNSEEIADTVRKYKVNRLYITPSRLLELVSFCRKSDVRLDSLDTIITGTETMPVARLKEAIEYFGPIIHVGYGMVEALPPLAILSPKDYEARGSVGRVLAGVEVKILDDGRIAFRGPTVSSGYLDNPDENARCFKEGWFYSSDYGCIDKNGFLHIFGRKEELLAQSPRLVFAAEIEEKLYELAFINRCAVGNKNGKIVIFASLRKLMGTQEAVDKILEKFQKTVLGREVPEIVLRERLPINALGKLDRNQLLG